MTMIFIHTTIDKYGKLYNVTLKMKAAHDAHYTYYILSAPHLQVILYIISYFTFCARIPLQKHGYKDPFNKIISNKIV